MPANGFIDGNGDFANNLTNAAAFSFDGGGGSDTANVRNSLNTENYTYTIASDGDIQEGVQSETASLAGHPGLGR